MKLEKLLTGKAIDGTIVTLLSSAEWLASVVAPIIAKKPEINVEKNKVVSTWDHNTTLIDLYTPRTAKPENGWPVALMIHGGGFRFFSKDTHALIATQIADMGYLTVACNYRTAPEDPYPLGLIDTLSVYDYIHQNAAKLEIDLSKIIIVGESAGANFGLGICLIASGLASLNEITPLKNDESFKRTLNWMMPKKAVLHCGYHQVTNVNRLEGKISKLVLSRVKMIQRNYLPESVENTEIKNWGLADPLCILENATHAPLSFPEVFIPVGTNDPVLDDSIRLDGALKKLSLNSKLKIYQDAPHSFYAMPWHKEYKNIWNDIKDTLITSL